MSEPEWLDAPHRRWNPLTGEWVLVSPQRAARPWQGLVESASPQAPAAAYDPACYLCPGNARAHGARNPDYASTFVFENDFPAMLQQEAAGSLDQGVLVAEPERGICRVLCFTPRHDLTLSRMEARDLCAVVTAWRDQARELSAIPWVRYVQIFENQGALMGASNPHPHGQVWASEHVPTEIAKERAGQRDFFEKHGACLLCAYAQAERAGERVVCANDSFLAVVPFWAVWPFEILVLPTRHFSGFEQMNETRDLAEILQQITRRYDALFQAPFPYSMGFHPAPARDADPAWHFHGHFYPPLLRSATIRKFMVGYEMLAGAQRDLTPETAAARLRDAISLP